MLRHYLRGPLLAPLGRLGRLGLGRLGLGSLGFGGRAGPHLKESVRLGEVCCRDRTPGNRRAKAALREALALRMEGSRGKDAWGEVIATTVDG